MVAVRNIVLLLLCVTVVAPIVLYTDRLGTFESPSSEFQLLVFIQIHLLWLLANGFGFFLLVLAMHSADKQEFIEDVTAFVSGDLE